MGRQQGGLLFVRVQEDEIAIVVDGHPFAGGRVDVVVDVQG